MKIGLANDHRGYPLKEKILKYLESKKIECVNYGTDSLESVDYPEFAFKLSNAVISGEVDFGVVICGTGIGISIACNKVKGIRCAKVSTEEEAVHTREDNDANIVALHGEMDKDLAFKIIDKFINTPFSDLEKHKRRIKMIKDYEDTHYAS